MEPSSRPSVLVLDSGVGGMTVVKAIRQLLPEVSPTYVADSDGFPYGKWEESALLERISLLAGSVLNERRLDAAVIACNTASTLVLDSLRARFPIPFVGVVPPIKTAGQLSRSRVFALLATEGTVRRSYVDKLIEAFAQDCRVIRVGSSDLADLAEDKIRGRRVDTGRLRAALAPLLTDDAQALDVVVLGCTHFPLLLEEMRALLRPDVLWLDPAEAIARRLRQVLSETSPVDPPPALAVKGDGEFFFTGMADCSAEMLRFVAGLGFRRPASWPPGVPMSRGNGSSAA